MNIYQAKQLIDGKAVLGYSKDRRVAYCVLNDCTEEILDLLLKGFYPDEPVCSLLELSKSQEAVKELNLLLIDTVKDNASIIAIDTENNKIVGACFNKIQIKPKPEETPYFEKFKRDICKNAKSIKVMDFMSEVDDKVDLFQTFNVEKLIELTFLVVAPTHRQQGIGFKLVHQSLDFIKSKSLATVTCMTGSSTFTKQIGDKLNFKRLAEVPLKRDTNTSDSVFEAVNRLHGKSVLFAKRL